MNKSQIFDIVYPQLIELLERQPFDFRHSPLIKFGETVRFNFDEFDIRKRKLKKTMCLYGIYEDVLSFEFIFNGENRKAFVSILFSPNKSITMNGVIFQNKKR